MEEFLRCFIPTVVLELVSKLEAESFKLPPSKFTWFTSTDAPSFLSISNALFMRKKPKAVMHKSTMTEIRRAPSLLFCKANFSPAADPLRRPPSSSESFLSKTNSMSDIFKKLSSQIGLRVGENRREYLLLTMLTMAAKCPTWNKWVKIPNFQCVVGTQGTGVLF